MKLITTNNINLDRETLNFYKKEFKNNTGLVLLPKKMMTEEEIVKYFSIANTFDISILGFVQNNGYEGNKKRGMNVLFAKHSFNKITQPDYFSHTFKEANNTLTFKIGMNGNSKKDYICDILLFPNNNEILKSNFGNNVKSLNKLCKDGILMYSTLEKDPKNEADQPFGIYDSNLKPLGERKDNFVVYNYK